ncbi:hypothetical protein [Leucobacter triazinivorans]|uniref:Integral membrane protein n=1 Tax=Leucobacter triazinivorans TaxID=1784719 RepID=A0A4P6KFI4_9MICO|nr:hypothetical protein [Leucobacter triazinivorans]QBE48930.1 hypothetical protein EVS81_08845 [Leucobacter triazinivorans]
MQNQQEIEALQAYVVELEERNRALQEAAERAPARSGRGRGRARTAVALVLVLVSVILAPVAVLGTWARLQLVDTDRFVQTFAPLAEQPEVQSFVTAQVVEGIEQNVDIDGMVGEVFDGISELDLPPRALAGLSLLEGPAAEGIRSLLGTGVERVVASPQFAQLWETALRETHSRAIAVIQGDPNTALQLSDDGTLSLELDTVIREVKEVLVQQGLGFAANIPEIERSIPLLTADSLILVRTLYQVAVAAGYWLPWGVLALLVAGVAVARNRTRAIAWAGAGLAVSFLLLAGGLGIGKQFFVGAVSPGVMPAATARVLFEQLTMLISSTLLALVALSLFVGVGGWLAGRSRAARAIRGAAESGFTAARSAADRRGIGTGGFGRAVERWRSAIIVATVGVGVLVLFLNRPISMGGVIGTLIVVLVVLLLVELVRRPGAAEPAAAGDEMEGAGAG